MHQRKCNPIPSWARARPWPMFRGSLSALALVVVLGGWPALAAAQQYTPESCAALKENRQQVIDNPDIFGGKQGIALRGAQYKSADLLRRGTP